MIDPYPVAMHDSAPFPTRRLSVKGVDLDDNAVVLSLSIARKLYRCPECGKELSVGAEHVLVRWMPPDGAPHHQHWHQECARALLREMRDIQTRPAGELDPRPRRAARRKGKK